MAPTYSQRTGLEREGGHDQDSVYRTKFSSSLPVISYSEPLYESSPAMSPLRYQLSQPEILD